MDLYREELKVWKECAAFREELESKAAGETGGGEVLGVQAGCENDPDQGTARKVPGAFEW